MSGAHPASTLAVRGLALRAGGLATGRELFSGLDLDVRAGERWVVVGPNGAGKSSLLAALAGVFAIARGEIVLDGRSLADWPLARLADERAWSPQFWSDPFPSTVAETAALASRRAGRWSRLFEDGPAADVGAVLARLDLARLADSDLKTLSGG